MKTILLRWLTGLACLLALVGLLAVLKPSPVQAHEGHAAADEHAAVQGQAAGEEAEGDEADHEDEEHAEDDLHEAMEDIGMLTKRLRRSLRDEAGLRSALARTRDLQEKFFEAKLMEPSWLAEVEDEQEQQKLRREFQLLMIETLQELLKCEAALLNGDMEAASEAVKRMLDVQDKGHAKFIR